MIEVMRAVKFVTILAHPEEDLNKEIKKVKEYN
jgi:hypothetical protein